jgi:ATP-dependent helicase HrpB
MAASSVRDLSESRTAQAGPLVAPLHAERVRSAKTHRLAELPTYRDLVTPLPIDDHLPAILAELRRARAVVLVAEPGAGKTTRVPPAIVAGGLLSPAAPNLVMLQPRRVAARAAAQRIADERSWQVGREVGYQVRFEKRVTRDTRLRVLTEGILTRQLLDDPTLDGVGCVVLDEFHERSIDTDLCIALLREVRDSLRDDLLLLVMSATLDAEPVSAFLGGAPVMRVPGRTFPVDVRYAPLSGERVTDRAAAAAVDVLANTSRADGGDVLVFLPGAGEIAAVCDSVAAAGDRVDADVLPLHGTLPFEQQLRALAPSPRRKVICSTNIAETSLTIDGVRTVIDTGVARQPLFDPSSGLDRLELVRISKASDAQRAGRAGRTSPGVCVRLWTAKEHAELPDFDEPELLRVDLCPTLLTLHAWGVADPRRFAFLQRPPEDALAAAEQLLEMLGALKDGRLTEVGRHLQTLPLHPRLGRLMLEAARWGCVDDGAAIAALLAEKDILRTEREERGAIGSRRVSGDSDVLLRLDALRRAERDRFGRHLWNDGIDPNAARQASRAAEDLLRAGVQLRERAAEGHGQDARATPRPAAADDRGATQPRSNGSEPVPEASGLDRTTALFVLPLLAYPDRVAKRRDKGGDKALMVGGVGVKLAEESCVRAGDAELFAAVDARVDRRNVQREALVRIASRVELDWLRQLFPDSVKSGRALRYDAEQEKVIATQRLTYRDLVLKESPTGDVDPQEAGRILGDALRPRARELLERDEQAAKLLARLRFLLRYVPEKDWPKLDDGSMGDLLVEACAGKKSLGELRAAGLANVIRNALVYPLDRQLDELAPEQLGVPTGNRIKLDYDTQAGPPVLAVRLQELFGQTDTPRVAGGRVKVLLHLLGPNYRPVQVTDDLASFWANTYAQVKKDLKARYPKHSWPDNPLTAPPQAKGRPTK